MKFFIKNYIKVLIDYKKTFSLSCRIISVVRLYFTFCNAIIIFYKCFQIFCYGLDKIIL